MKRTKYYDKSIVSCFFIVKYNVQAWQTWFWHCEARYEFPQSSIYKRIRPHKIVHY